MMTPSQKSIFYDLYKNFQEASGKKIDGLANVNTGLLALLRELDVSRGSPKQKIIIEVYIHILIRIGYDPQSFKSSLVRKLEYAFDSIDRHLITNEPSLGKY